MGTASGGASAKDAFSKAVEHGLGKPGQKELPCSYLYDALGSILFEAITFLPEYGVTRAEQRVIDRCANEVAGLLPSVRSVAELGSGNGAKTRRVLGEFARRLPIDYYPIDVSEIALARCRLELGGLSGVGVHPILGSYLPSLRGLERSPDNSGRMLVLFLGSTIGNFHRGEAAAFLTEVRGALARGDAFMLGADLDKSEGQLLLAYDDPTGVTAAFNLNLLGHINRELGADFDLNAFAHEARFDRGERRIEMHLRSTKSQVVTFPTSGFQITIKKDETIWTESSYRYSPSELTALARVVGFREMRTWVDEEWPFASSLWIAE